MHICTCADQQEDHEEEGLEVEEGRLCSRASSASKSCLQWGGRMGYWALGLTMMAGHRGFKLGVVFLGLLLKCDGNFAWLTSIRIENLLRRAAKTVSWSKLVIFGPACGSTEASTLVTVRTDLVAAPPPVPSPIHFESASQRNADNLYLPHVKIHLRFAL